MGNGELVLSISVGFREERKVPSFLQDEGQGDDKPPFSDSLYSIGVGDSAGSSHYNLVLPVHGLHGGKLVCDGEGGGLGNGDMFKSLVA